MNQPIGIFDSGVGGLTVVKEVMRQLPNEDIVYFGDTARVPYGSKSRDTIIRFSRQICHFLQTREVKAIVIACNTASAIALEALEQEIDIPMLGVVKPGAAAAAAVTQNRHIGIIGTEATIKSRIYNTYLKKLDPEITIASRACPLFVPLVEEGLLEDRVTEDIASRYLHEFHEYEIDTLILGCTHYPLLSHTLQRVMGNHVKLVNPAFETAKSLKSLLTDKGLRKTENMPGEYRYYVSDGVNKFIRFADKTLNCRVNASVVREVNIEEY